MHRDILSVIIHDMNNQTTNVPSIIWCLLWGIVTHCQVCMRQVYYKRQYMYLCESKLIAFILKHWLRNTICLNRDSWSCLYKTSWWIGAERVLSIWCVLISLYGSSTKWNCMGRHINLINELPLQTCLGTKTNLPLINNILKQKLIRNKNWRTGSNVKNVQFHRQFLVTKCRNINKLHNVLSWKLFYMKTNCIK